MWWLVVVLYLLKVSSLKKSLDKKCYLALWTDPSSIMLIDIKRREGAYGLEYIKRSISKEPNVAPRTMPSIKVYNLRSNRWQTIRTLSLFWIDFCGLAKFEYPFFLICPTCDMSPGT